jgi:hypothetical protein
MNVVLTIAILLMLTHIGVMFGKDLAFKGFVNPSLYAWVNSLGLLMFACLFTLVSMLVWQVIYLMLV